jgi:GNAT superfamily N-acetyltransferase
MKNITIRELRGNDMEQMLVLLKSRDDLGEGGAEKRQVLMEWLAFKNPYENDEATYFIADDQGKIVAHLGRMPMEFVIKGNLRRGYYFHDLYVHPEYRKKGLGLFLSMSLYNAAEKNSKSFCFCIWTNEINLNFQRKRGYHELKYPSYVKILDPYPILIKRIKGQKQVAKIASLILKQVLWILDFFIFSLSKYRSKEIKVFEINRFDENFDCLQKRLLDKIGISPFKSSNYLNWKYVDRPFPKTTIFMARKNNEICGAIVLAMKEREGLFYEGTIVDILADPSDKEILWGLFRTAIDYFRKKKVCSIKCCSADSKQTKILKKFLFFGPVLNMPLTIANVKKLEEEERGYFQHIDNWHINYGDSDGLMLVP